MMIDYLTLMLINMAAGLFLLGCFVWRDLDTPEDFGRWVPAFAICGLVAAIGGFAITFTWPLPQPYNSAFGEMSVLLGVLWLGLALALAKKWELLPLAIYAVFAGAAAARSWRSHTRPWPYSETAALGCGIYIVRRMRHFLAARCLAKQQ